MLGLERNQDCKASKARQAITQKIGVPPLFFLYGDLTNFWASLDAGNFTLTH